MQRAEKFERLEALYRRWNHPLYIEPDPLQWVRGFSELADRELVGLIAAGLAYGRVVSVNASISRVMAFLGDHPVAAASARSPSEWATALEDFRHRWTSGAEVAELLVAIPRILEQQETLGALVARTTEGADLESGLGALVEALQSAGVSPGNSLLVDPRGPSAAKRMWMFARWMVRQDAVDPGGWSVDPSGLRMPMDVHVFRLCRRLRWVRSRTPGRLACIQATQSFARGCPEDPVRYDFCLSRLGIRSDATYGELFGDL